MREIPLTQGKFALVDHEDYDFLMQWKWFYNNGYACRGFRKNGNSGKIMMHRLLLRFPENKEIDHINRDKSDNQRSNLRIGTLAENQRNKTKQKNNTSGYKGVSWKKDKQKWFSFITFNKKRIFLGYYFNKKDAAKAYNRMALILHGEFACLNQLEVNPCV